MPVTLTDILSQATPFTELDWMERRLAESKQKAEGYSTREPEKDPPYIGFFLFSVLIKPVRGALAGAVAGGIVANYLLGGDAEVGAVAGGFMGCVADSIQYIVRGNSLNQKIAEYNQDYIAANPNH